MSNKSRAFQFTWNNYTDDDVEYLKGQSFRYLIFGREKGESGTPHLQGMIVFENPRSFESIRKKIFLEKAHLEVARSQQALMKYNKKEGDWEEYGNPPEQGRRYDIEEMVDMVKGGSKAKQLWEHNSTLMLQYNKAFERCRYDMMEDREEPPKVFWFYGGTGTGKTRKAFEYCESRYIKDGTMWWDGYSQQKAIIIDDFDGHWPYRDLLRLLDRYPYSGQVKGGYVKINSPFIFITCEHHPSLLWSGAELAQILRRIFEVQFFEKKE